MNTPQQQEEEKLNVKELWQEYAPPSEDELLFTEEDNKTLLLKEIIQTALTSFDRTILLLYVEKGSLRQVAKSLDVSHSAIIKKMDQIKLHVMSEFYEHQKRIFDVAYNRSRQNNREKDKSLC